MSFGEAVRSVYRNYATFDGRAPRSEYWWFQLFFLAVLLGIAFLGGFLGVASRSSAMSGVVGLGAVVFALGSLIPSLAVTSRRLHDSEKSGWWLLLVFVPFGSLVLFIFTLLPSSIGFNRFGPPRGEQPGDHRVQYFGPTRSEALQKFAGDAQDAAMAGYQPVAQYWKGLQRRRSA